MDRIKEKIRERVLQQVPTGVDVDEKYLADAIDRVITEIGQEQYMRFGERKKMRREIFNSMRKLDVLLFVFRVNVCQHRFIAITVYSQATSISLRNCIIVNSP